MQADGAALPNDGGVVLFLIGLADLELLDLLCRHDLAAEQGGPRGQPAPFAASVRMIGVKGTNYRQGCG